MSMLTKTSFNTLKYISFTLALLSLLGCATGASMKIDVEVYNGPLSKEPIAQWGELKGILKQAENDVTGLYETFIKKPESENPTLGQSQPQGENQPQSQRIENLPKLLVKQRQDVAQKKANNESIDIGELTQDSCASLFGLVKLGSGRSGEIDAVKRCLTVNNVKLAVLNTRKQLSKLNTEIASCDDDINSALDASTDAEKVALLRKAKKCYRESLSDIIAFATALRANAFVIAETHVGFADESRLVRGIQVGMATFASEYGNQLSSRADALLKQMRSEHRKVMPISTYLRDADSTDFLNLFVWNYAGAPSFCEEGCSDDRSARNRVKTVERLFQSHNWQKINSVYASGMGTVNMAFVKDDIGNWNLKSFESDPSELLNAYKEAGKAAINTVKKLAETPAGLSKAKAALNIANDIALGQGGQEQLDSQAQTISKLKQFTLEKLNKLKTDLSEKAQSLPAQVTEKEAQLAQKNGEIKTHRQEIKKLRDNRPAGEKLALENRITQLEARIALKNEQIAALNGRISDVTNPLDANSITTLNGLISDLDESIEKDQEEKQSIEEKLALQEQTDQKISDIQELLTPLENEVADLTKELEPLKSELSQLPRYAKAQTLAILEDYGRLVDGMIEVSKPASEESGAKALENTTVTSLPDVLNDAN